MFLKAMTWGKAFGIITKNMLFWSPSTYHKSQRFVGEIIQYDLINRYSCPHLKQIPLADLSTDFDIESIKLKEFKGTYGGVSLVEILLLCRLTQERRPRSILEIGTFQGITTLNLALNSPPDTKIITVDLPALHNSTRFYQTDPELSLQRPRSNLWKDYGVQNKITQFLCDSAELSANHLPENIDMIFIDGSHSYEYVSKDTEFALSILSPKGMILWHDYYPINQAYKYLNELAQSKPLSNIIGTSLVLFESA
jgi:hypothetical protein